MKLIDLFCGCGGLSLGFQNAGFNILSGFDNWEPAINVYKENFKHPIIKFDLSNIEDYLIFDNYNPDMIIGGPPCQDFSSAGKRNENLGRADLTLSFANIISALKPEFFIMENVERITKSKILEKVIKIYKDNGYGLTSKVLDASYCNVPQNRKRYFLIGHLNAEDGFLDYYLDKNLNKNQMTIFDYLGNELGIEFYYRHPRSYQRRGIFSIYEPSPTIRGVNRPIPPNYNKHLGDACEVNEKLRPLTTLERSYLQTFPKDFIFKGSKTNLEQMIGNAVPVKLAEYVAENILEYIDDIKNKNKISHFRQLELKF